MYDNDFDLTSLETTGDNYVSPEELSLEGKQDCIMPLFIVIDTSGSMSGDKIEQVRIGLEKIKTDLTDMNMNNDDAQVKVSVMTFDSQVNWVTKNENPENISTSLKLGSVTRMGAAFKELESMLSRSKLIQKGACAGYKRAVMIVLTDGMPTDNFDDGLTTLMTNHWFTAGTRIGVAIGNDADVSCLEKFTGAKESVLRVDNNSISFLSQVLANVATVASETNSHAPNANDPEYQGLAVQEFEASAAETVKIIKSAMENMAQDGIIPEPDPQGGTLEENPFANW